MDRSVRVPISQGGIAGLENPAYTDSVVVEEPLEIRVGDRPLSVTLRTPGEDIELATGFAITESIVKSAGEIREVRHWGSPNVVRIALHDGAHVDWQRLQRHFYATSSCGVCGKTSIDSLRVHTAPVTKIDVDPNVITSLPEKLRAHQKTFDAT